MFNFVFIICIFFLKRASNTTNLDLPSFLLPLCFPSPPPPSSFRGPSGAGLAGGPRGELRGLRLTKGSLCVCVCLSVSLPACVWVDLGGQTALQLSGGQV